MRKDSPNLYEILKSATGGSTAPSETQARPVAVAEPTAPAESPTPKPASAPRVVVPTRPPAPTTLPPTLPIGQRTLTLSYNTAIFAGLVALAAVFLGFAVGQRWGRSKGKSEAAAAPAGSPASHADTTPAPAGRVWAIKLLEWPGTTSREYVNAESNAESIKKTLVQNQHAAAWYAPAVRGDRRVLVLYYGKYEQRNEEAREKLATLRKYKYNRTTPFSGADFVEVER